jgi:hypothetical protein
MWVKKSEFSKAERGYLSAFNEDICIDKVLSMLSTEEGHIWLVRFIEGKKIAHLPTNIEIQILHNTAFCLIVHDWDMKNSADDIHEVLFSSYSLRDKDDLPDDLLVAVFLVTSYVVRPDTLILDLARVKFYDKKRYIEGKAITEYDIRPIVEEYEKLLQ